jgi:hypothetical protein
VAVALNADGTGGFLVPLGGGLHRFAVADGRPVDARLAAGWPLRYSSDQKHLAFPASREVQAEQLAVISTDDEPTTRPLGKFGGIGVVRPMPDGSFLVTAASGRRPDHVYTGTRVWPDGRVEELWNLLPDNRVSERTAFLPSPLIGVSTNWRLVTTVIDLRSGRVVLEIDNSANHRLEMTSYYAGGWGFAERLLVAALALAVPGVLLAWRSARQRRVSRQP